MTHSTPRISSEASATRSPNPFPASAVARLSALHADGVSIATPALEQALAYADDYISRIRHEDVGVEVQSDDGNVVAIVGEYGTGKTHLAMQILRRISEPDQTLIHSLYLDAPADTFLALYRDRFMPKLSRTDVRDRVAEYYADIVADQLSDSDLTASTAKALKERAISPEAVVQNFGLMDSEFRQSLTAQLRRVTEMDDFGSALALFLRPEFEPAVWEWLSCNPPDPALMERGIRKTIDTDAQALEAMGVFALLYGRQGHRFVLVIDELEKVLSEASPYGPEEGAVLAFKKLLEVFGKTRTFLVLSGLPDFLEALPEDAKQRIACFVRPTALTVADTTQYIEESQRRASGKPSLKPFTRDVIEYLVELAGGNARKIVRLCYHSFQAAASADTDVTRAMVREAARDQFELTTTEDVRAEITRVFDRNGWLFEANHRFGAAKNSPRSDFWLPVGDQGAGCAVVIARSVLHPNDAQRLEQLAKRIVGNDEVTRLTLLVINGYLAETLSNRVSKAFHRVVTYATRRVSEDVDAAVKGMRRRIESTEDENILVLLRDRIEQISRQNSVMRGSLDEILANTSSPALVERAAEKGVRRAFVLASGSRITSDSRFPRVNRVFDDFLNQIASARQPLDRVVDIVLGAFGRLSANASSEEQMYSRDILPVARDLGVLRVIEDVAGAFRENVLSMMEFPKVSSSFITRLSSSSSDVRELCRLFDDIANILVRELGQESSREFVEDVATGLGSSPMSRMREFEELRDSMRSLGGRVYEAVRLESRP